MYCLCPRRISPVNMMVVNARSLSRCCIWKICYLVSSIFSIPFIWRYFQVIKMVVDILFKNSHSTVIPNFYSSSTSLQISRISLWLASVVSETDTRLLFQCFNPRSPNALRLMTSNVYTGIRYFLHRIYPMILYFHWWHLWLPNSPCPIFLHFFLPTDSPSLFKSLLVLLSSPCIRLTSRPWACDGGFIAAAFVAYGPVQTQFEAFRLVK